MATGKDNHEALRLRVTWGKSCNRESLRPGLSLVIAQLCYGPVLLWPSFAMGQLCYGSVLLRVSGTERYQWGCCKRRKADFILPQWPRETPMLSIAWLKRPPLETKIAGNDCACLLLALKIGLTLF